MLQVVFVKWGTKYSAAYVNALVEATLANTKAEVRFVCLTDDDKGLDDRIVALPFPDLGVPEDALKKRNGSLLKLGIFVEGVLKDGVETAYIDLDSAVMGDIERLASCLKQKRGLYSLSRHAIQYWRVPGLMKLIAPKRYYLSNTAIMAFYPEDWRFIPKEFRETYHRFHAGDDTLDPDLKKLYVGGNEYLISHAAQGKLRVFPRDVAIKFTQEYMSPILGIAKLKNHMPWIKARRKRQAVLTFHGVSLKPEYLVDMKEGQLVTHKFHKTIWHYPQIRDYWRRMLAVDEG